MSVITIIIRSCQMASSLLCLIMWAATAGFQAKWDVGPSGLSGCVVEEQIRSRLKQIN